MGIKYLWILLFCGLGLVLFQNCSKPFLSEKFAKNSITPAPNNENEMGSQDNITAPNEQNLPNNDQGLPNNNAAMPQLPMDRGQGDLPFAGRFIGAFPMGGTATANGILRKYQAVRYIVEKSGVIDKFSFHNRHYVGAGADSPVIAYTHPNSYSAGNPRIKFEIWSDDGENTHFPKNRIGGATTAFHSREKDVNGYPTIVFEEPVPVQLGEIIHIVYNNTTPPTINVKGSSLAAAQAEPPENGAQGLNGSLKVYVGPKELSQGPMWGHIGGTILGRDDPNAPWDEDDLIYPWFTLGYDDGTWVGNSYISYDVPDYIQNGIAVLPINGNLQVRQRLEYSDPRVTVDRVWIQYGHDDQVATISGAPLEIEVRASNGDLLATGELPASPETHKVNREGGSFKPNARTWGTSAARLSNDVEFTPGQTYYLTLSTASGGGFAITAHRDGELPNRNSLDQGAAEISTNGGQTWSPSTPSYFPGRDIPFLFVPKGLPEKYSY